MRQTLHEFSHLSYRFYVYLLWSVNHGVANMLKHIEYSHTPWQSWQWVSGSWVMGQMGHQFWMGHMGHGSTSMTHWPMIKYTNLSANFDVLFNNIMFADVSCCLQFSTRHFVPVKFLVLPVIKKLSQQPDRLHQLQVVPPLPLTNWIWIACCLVTLVKIKYLRELS